MLHIRKTPVIQTRRPLQPGCLPAQGQPPVSGSIGFPVGAADGQDTRTGLEALESFNKSVRFLFVEDPEDNDFHLLYFKENPALVHSQAIEGSFFAFDLFYQFSLWKRIILENLQVCKNLDNQADFQIIQIP